MKSVSLSIFLASCFLTAIAHEKNSSPPNYVKEVFAALQGNFKWKMIRPSDNKILRTGAKTSTYQLDSLALLSYENFDSSKVRQMGLFGFRKSESTFFSIGMYNIDIGPHIINGKFNKKEGRIEFYENDSSKLFLNIVDFSKYYWTYQTLKKGIWEERDLKIVFERE